MIFNLVRIFSLWLLDMVITDYHCSTCTWPVMTFLYHWFLFLIFRNFWNPLISVWNAQILTLSHLPLYLGIFNLHISNIALQLGDQGKKLRFFPKTTQKGREKKILSSRFFSSPVYFLFTSKWWFSWYIFRYDTMNRKMMICSPKMIFLLYWPSCRLKVLQNAPREHSAMLLTFTKVPPVINIFLSNYHWPL